MGSLSMCAGVVSARRSPLIQIAQPSGLVAMSIEPFLGRASAVVAVAARAAASASAFFAALSSRKKKRPPAPSATATPTAMYAAGLRFEGGVERIDAAALVPVPVDVAPS